jgi:hypothetical protein
VPRTSPFAGVVDGPAPEAVTVEIGRPKPVAVGCFGLVTLFLAILAVAAFTFAANLRVNKSASSAGSLRVLAVVLGIVFAVIVVFLFVVTVKALRTRQGLAFDERAAWWRDGDELVELPWTDIAAARLVRPKKTRGRRSSQPLAPSLELYPADMAALRGHQGLMTKVAVGEPARSGLPRMRFSFSLPGSDTADLVESTMGRFAPDALANGREETAE